MSTGLVRGNARGGGLVSAPPGTAGRGPVLRAGLLGGLGAASTGALAWWLLGEAAARWPDAHAAPVEDGLAFVVTAAAAVVAGWLSALLLAATASLLGLVPDQARAIPRGAAERRRVVGGRIVGGLSGRVAAGLLAAASIGTVPAAAVPDVPAAHQVVSAWQGHAASAHRSHHAGPALVGGVSIEAARQTGAPAAVVGTAPDAGAGRQEAPMPGWTPTITSTERPATPAGDVHLVTTAPARNDVQVDEVVVQRGDTLWAIAARHLGAHATDQDVAESWPRWFAANREAIGDDPDLLRPGQRLVPPTWRAGR